MLRLLTLMLFSLLFASEFMREVVRELVKELPLEQAVKVGSGERELIVFMNPDCPHCRKEWAELRKHLDELKLFVFLVPFKGWGEENARKVYFVLCSDEPAEALDAVLTGKLDGKVPPVEPCERVEAHLKAARIVGLEGVPYNILPQEGRIIEGASEELYRLLGLR
ncbi:MAG: thioredoxin fold domain-containing protein [Aquificae bacterium]|nr:thioredoxin fold domain-containing protein [Aquificota bacterium]